MKKVLLATTMLVAGASIAAAEVTVSGDARMGVIKTGTDNALTLSTNEGAAQFTSRARVTFTLSAESDAGLSYGASFRADNAAAAAGGNAGSVFVSGAFGKLSMGDVDGAAQMATGNVAGVGLTGLGDLNESTFYSAGGAAVAALSALTPEERALLTAAGYPTTATNDPTLLYEYSAGAFTGYLSYTNPRDNIWADPSVANPGAADRILISNAEAYAVGAKYTFGDYTVGLGYEKMSGYVVPDLATAPNLLTATPNNTDVKNIVVSASGTFAGVTVKGVYGKASGRIAGKQIVGPGQNGKQYALSASYTTNGVTGTAFYTDDSGVGGTAAYGVGASYDLGAGAALTGGVAKTKANGPDTTSFDIGVSLKF